MKMQMENDSPVKADGVNYNAANVTVQNPAGTVYFELSTSASKNYENNKAGFNDHIAKSFAENNIQSYSLVKVTDANAIYRYLIEQGIVVRNRTRVQLCKDCLRITIGTRQENNELLGALRFFK